MRSWLVLKSETHFSFILQFFCVKKILPTICQSIIPKRKQLVAKTSHAKYNFTFTELHTIIIVVIIGKIKKKQTLRLNNSHRYIYFNSICLYFRFSTGESYKYILTFTSYSYT